MYAVGNDIESFIEEFAPLEWALDGDPSGIQWGDLKRETKVVLIALDFSEEVLEEALQLGASFVFTHHPYLFHPLRRIDLANRREALVARALKEGITLYAAHTNLDVAPKGVSQALGDLFELKEMKILCPTGREELEKLVVFVPQGYEDPVRSALAGAGAGFLGNYSHCTFQVAGTSTFLPEKGASPFIGRRGNLEKVAEYRLETVYPRRIRNSVLDALFTAHPYEEVAYDVYALKNEGQVWGLGRFGAFEKPLSLKELVKRCRELFGPVPLKVSGDPEKTVARAAVLGGSGSEYISYALRSGVDVFISGDIKYHDAQEAALSGLAVIDAGHEVTERPVLPVIGEFLSKKMAEAGLGTKVVVSRKESSPWQLLGYPD